MPYVRCPGCGLRTFSAAYWSSTEECGRCGVALPREVRAYRPAAPSPQVLAQLRARRGHASPRPRES
jgi:ribosomal protein L37E